MFPNHKFESFTYAIMKRIRNVTKTVHKWLPSERFPSENKPMALKNNILNKL